MQDHYDNSRWNCVDVDVKEWRTSLNISPFSLRSISTFEFFRSKCPVLLRMPILKGYWETRKSVNRREKREKAINCYYGLRWLIKINGPVTSDLYPRKLSCWHCRGSLCQVTFGNIPQVYTIGWLRSLEPTKSGCAMPGKYWFGVNTWSAIEGRVLREGKEHQGFTESSMRWVDFEQISISWQITKRRNFVCVFTAPTLLELGIKLYATCSL
jgi:hypothetical protein